MRLGEGTLGGLDEADAVLGVALGLVEATHLVLELLRDGHAGGVIGSAVDPEARRKVFGLLGVDVLAGGQATLGRGCGEVVVDA